MKLGGERQTNRLLEKPGNKRCETKCLFSPKRNS